MSSNTLNTDSTLNIAELTKLAGLLNIAPDVFIAKAIKYHKPENSFNTASHLPTRSPSSSVGRSPSSPDEPDRSPSSPVGRSPSYAPEWSPSSQVGRSLSSSEKELQLQLREQKIHQTLSQPRDENMILLLQMQQKLVEKEKELAERERQALLRERESIVEAEKQRLFHNTNMGAMPYGAVRIGVMPYGGGHMSAMPYSGGHMSARPYGGGHTSAMPPTHERQASHSHGYNFTPSDSSRGLSRIAPHLVRF